MKRLTIIITILIIAIMAFTLTGCGADGLSRLNRQINRVMETVDSIDNVNTADMKEFAPIDSSIENSIINLSINQNNFSQENILKISEIADLFISIRDNSNDIVSGRYALRDAVQEVKEAIQAFRGEERTLTAEQRAQINGYINEIAEINGIMRGTIGNAYRKMHNLRGKYQLENIDLVLTTYRDVDAVLQVRIENIIRLNEIAEEILTMLQ